MPNIYSDKIITFTVSNGENTAQLAVLLVKKDAPSAHWETRVYVRTEPKGTESSRWETLSVGASLWPSLSSGKRNGFIGVLQGHLTRRCPAVPEHGVTISGVYEVDVHDADKSELEDGTVQPKHLFQGSKGIDASFAGTTPLTIHKANLVEAATWLTDGPILALGNGSTLDPWTKSPLSTSHVAVAMPTAKAPTVTGYTLSDGSAFFTRVFRTVNGVDISDVDYVRMQADRKRTILLVGPGGTGKTSVLEAASDRLFISLGNNEMTTLSLYGRFEPDAASATGFSWAQSELVKSIRYAQEHPEQRVTWLLDEAMQMPDEVQINLHPLLDHRRMLVIEEGPDKGTLPAPDNWTMVAASNPHEPGARLGRPFASRLMVMPYFTNWDVVEQVVGPGYELLITVAKAMETARRNRTLDWAPQMRHIKVCVEEMKFLGPEYGLAYLVNACDAETGFCNSRDVEELERIIAETYSITNLRRLAFD